MTRFCTTVLLLAAPLALGACRAAPSPASTTDTPVAAVPADASTATMQIAGLSCPLCASNADKSLRRLPGVFDARTSLTTGDVALWLDPAATPTPEALADAVLDAGFTVTRGAENTPAPPTAVGDDPVIKGYGVLVAVSPPADGHPPTDAAVATRLRRLPGVAVVRVDHAGSHVELTFTADACLTEGQVRNAVNRTGYAAGSIKPVTEAGAR